MSNLSELIPAGAGAKTAQFTASGALTSGQLVALQSNGTATAISSSNYTDFVGVTAQAIADTATGSVVLQGGVGVNLTGLTTGSDYYLYPDGSLQLAGERDSFGISRGLSLNTIVDLSSVTGILIRAVGFNSDGTKMFVLSATSDSVFQYSSTTGFDLSTATYDSVSFLVTEDITPHGLAFNSDGTKMFIAGYTNRTVYQYSLSTAFDLSTASYDSVSFSYTAQGINVAGFTFSTDGTKMFLTDNSTVYQYSLSTGFDLSTASYDSVTFSTSPQTTTIRGIAFNSDGTKMFATQRFDDIFQYSLSTGFDISTASYDSIYADITFNELGQLTFSADGTKMFVPCQKAGVSGFVAEFTVALSNNVFVGNALSPTSLLLGG